MPRSELYVVWKLKLIYILHASVLTKWMRVYIQIARPWEVKAVDFSHASYICIILFIYLNGDRKNCTMRNEIDKKKNSQPLNTFGKSNILDQAKR